MARRPWENSRWTSTSALRDITQLAGTLSARLRRESGAVDRTGGTSAADLIGNERLRAAYFGQ